MGNGKIVVANKKESSESKVERMIRLGKLVEKHKQQIVGKLLNEKDKKVNNRLALTAKNTKKVKIIE